LDWNNMTDLPAPPVPTDREFLQAVLSRLTFFGPWPGPCTCNQCVCAKHDWQQLRDQIRTHLASPPTDQRLIKPKTTPDDKLRSLIGHLRDATPAYYKFHFGPKGSKA
jgi:hypothetical protein